MPTTAAICPACRKDVEGDSAFCRHCGQALPKQETAAQPSPGSDIQSVLQRTAGFSDLGGAAMAIVDYKMRWPDGPATLDVNIAAECVRFIRVVSELSEGKFDEHYHDVSDRADRIGSGIPECLQNGLLTSCRVGNEENRALRRNVNG